MKNSEQVVNSRDRNEGINWEGAQRNVLDVGNVLYVDRSLG